MISKLICWLFGHRLISESRWGDFEWHEKCPRCGKDL